MSKSLKIVIIPGIIVFLIVILRPFVIIPEGEQVVVTRFGRIVKIHSTAGLKIKFPVIDSITRYSRKILSWDGDPQRLPTSENQFIWVDTTARWRIVDPTTFYQRVTIMSEAYSRLDNVIESAVRTVVSQYPLSESVRSTNDILLVGTAQAADDSPQADNSPDSQQEADKIQTDTPDSENGDEQVENLLQNAFAPINQGRRQLSQEMLTRSQESMPEYGIELLDVVIRQIRYSDDLTQSVYDRMISERRKVATGYRSEGNGLKAEWLGRLNRDRDIKLSKADREAAQIRAEGNAEAARIYSRAYSVDPEFYSFWKAIESYRSTLPSQRKILTTDIDYFRYLHNRNGS